MRKLLCLLVSVLMCVSLTLPVLAEENLFTPSVTYKNGPAIEMVDMNGEDVGDCVVVSSIEQAEKKTTDISQEDRDLLLEVYKKLESGEMTLPLEEGYVIRDLVDVSFKYQACRLDEAHGHKDEQLKEDGVVLTVTFDMNLGTFEDIIVLVYMNGEAIPDGATEGQWVSPKSVKNNGDGTLTVVFEDICPVAFAVKQSGNTQNPTTGDTMGNQLMLVMGMMVISAAGVVALLISKARKAY